MDNKKTDIIEILSTIMDPSIQKDLVTAELIHDLHIEDDKVTLSLLLTNPDQSMKSTLKVLIESAVLGIDWVKELAIHFIPPKNQGLVNKGGLSDVKTVIAVSSCKGGVGKSTTAVNLAFSLAKTGAKVGIFDADVYGPSLATMVGILDSDPQLEDEMLIPYEKFGVKLMSFAYVLEKDAARDPAALRGPMVTQVITQLLTGTLWGDLDYLIIDYPPGTGDVQLTLGQLVPATAAVIVTTPQTLSVIDVEKGIYLFDKLAVPTVAVIENMSYFIVPGTEEKHYPFGSGASQKLKDQFGFETIYELPLYPELSQAGDSGVPLVVSDPKHPASLYFETISKELMQSVANLQFNISEKEEWLFDGKSGLLSSKSSPESSVSAKAVRLQCLSANNTVTEGFLEQIEDSAPYITIRSIVAVGNYAYGIEWEDGHYSIFPKRKLLEMVKEPTIEA